MIPLTSREPVRSLVIETSGRSGAVALAAGDHIVSMRVLDETRRHARDLAPTTAMLLQEQGRAPRDIHAVVVDIGPGSYTGLRVGIMSAKTFAYATGAVVLGVPAFFAVAEQAPAEMNCLDVVADAQQERIYLQRFVRTEAGWRPATELQIVTISSWLADSESDAPVSGPGLQSLASVIGAGKSLLPDAAWNPRPESLLHLALSRFRRGEADNLHTIEPLYLRPSSAEEQWKKRSSG